MGNNHALQVGAEALSGVLGGAVAAIMVKLSLIVLSSIAIAAAACPPFIRVPRDTASEGSPPARLSGGWEPQ